jgi:SAM-dependent methyltransferase
VDGRHGLYRQLIEAFYRKTGCPVVVNTSFNLGWDPIVHTPKDAYDTFMSCDIDVLVLGHFVLTKPAQASWVPAEARGESDAIVRELWHSPCCHAGLAAENSHVSCEKCGRNFPVEDGVPLLFWPHEGHSDPGDVTEKVKAFYEQTPFPNYDDHDSVRSLIEKSRKGIYAKKLNEAVPYNSTVLEVGCGTGQLANFLGISCRTVVGTDICLNSLRLGEEFRRKHGLHRVRFVQMNLFRPAFKPEQFDVILCNGVLHHTSDPYGGFQGLVPLLKPGGHVVVGLYNKYGRLLLDLRRVVFRLTGGRLQWLDSYLRAGQISEAKRRAWFADQYQHPHESKHTIGEVLRWFEDCGLEFVRGVPTVVAGDKGLAGARLFEPTPPGSPWDHFLVQAQQVLGGSREGGFFLMIGRKPRLPVRPRAAEPAPQLVAH